MATAKEKLEEELSICEQWIAHYSVLLLETTEKELSHRGGYLRKWKKALVTKRRKAARLRAQIREQA
jgi:hypothetical protein